MRALFRGFFIIIGGLWGLLRWHLFAWRVRRCARKDKPLPAHTVALRCPKCGQIPHREFHEVEQIWCGECVVPFERVA